MAFMHALTDSMIAVHVPARVPSGLPPAGLDSEAGEVNIEVYNILGQVVRRLFRGYRPVGVYQLAWDGLDEGGQAAASGVYLVSAQMGGARYLARMTLVR